MFRFVSISFSDSVSIYFRFGALFVPRVSSKFLSDFVRLFFVVHDFRTRHWRRLKKHSQVIYMPYKGDSILPDCLNVAEPTLGQIRVCAAGHQPGMTHTVSYMFVLGCVGLGWLGCVALYCVLGHAKPSKSNSAP